MAAKSMLGFKRLLNREGSLRCYTCCDTGPRFMRSHLMVLAPHLVALDDKQGILRTFLADLIIINLFMLVFFCLGGQLILRRG